MPDVTVLVPTRNRSRFLRRALQSVLQQDDADFEVVVVDDASTDGTARMVEGLGDPRVQLLRLRHRSGVAAARNAGIEAAGGRWVAFLDDDDVWAPQKLRKQQDRAAETNASLVYTGVVLLDEDGAALEPVRLVEPDELIPGLLETNLVGTPSSVLADAELVRRVGAFDEQLESLADWDLWIRLVDAAPAALSPEYLSGYTLHREGIHLQSPARMRTEMAYLRRKHQALGRRHGVKPVGSAFQLWLASRYRRSGQTAAAARLYLAAGLATRRPRHLLRGLALLGGERTARLGRHIFGEAGDAGEPAGSTLVAFDDLLAAAQGQALRP